MNSIEKIINIISKKKNIIYSNKKAQHELISILRELTPKDKKEIKPKVLKLMHIYRQEYYNGTENSNNFHLACAAGFVVLSQKEYAQYGGADEKQILPWYCPPWYSDYYNNEQWMAIGYTLLLQYISKGYIIPAGNKIALELVELKNSFSDFKSITLEKHIWTLFHYESEVHLTKRYPKFGKLEWGAKLIELSNENKISREKLLSECLLVTTRNFNKVAVGFFFDIFEQLTPTDIELLKLQDTLFIVLQSQHSKPINQTLKYLKRIYKEPSFDVEGFMEQVPLLLSSSVKAVVNATLGLIDVLIKAYPTHKEALAILATQALAQEDESLQTKTIKILAKHKLLETPSILDEIAIYTEGLYHSTKQLLPEREDVTTEDETIEITPLQHIREDNRIIYPESFDEMVFFFSQVFEGNNIYDFDLFVDLLPKIYNLHNDKNTKQLEPAFQRAYKFYKSSQNIDKTVSEIRLTMAQALLYFGTKYLNNQKAVEYYNDMLLYENNRSEEYHWYKSVLVDFKNITLSPSIFSIYHSIISKVFIALDKKKTLFKPLLMLSTHSPCFIEFSKLIERLVMYQKNDIQIDVFDLQISMSRVIPDNISPMNTLKGEIRDIFEYFTSDDILEISKIITPSMWIVPVLRKNNSNDLMKFSQVYQKSTHDVNMSDIFNGSIINENKRINIASYATQLIRTLSFDSVFTHTNYTPPHTKTSIDLDIILYLTPFIPNFILESISKSIYDSFQEPMISLITIWNNVGKNNYIFIAKSFLEGSIETRTLASELWHKATLEGTMNHQLLGETLGKLEHNEYAPLKRFTDLVVSNMLNLSTLHNQGLHTLLSTMIAQMNDKPIKGAKKLLEIYLEVLSLTKLSVPGETIQKFEVWGEVKSLKSVVKKIVA